MLYDVFVSYAREDAQLAGRYYDELTKLGLKVWFDRLATDRDSRFEQIADALRRSSYVLLLWSKHAREAHFVRREITYAEELGKKIIPIKTDGRGFTAGISLILAGTKPLQGRHGIPRTDLANLARRIVPDSQNSARVFLLLNMKGGVGKTTLAANLGGTFHAMGQSVLLVDLDAQANLSNLLMSEQRYAEAVTLDRSVISCFEDSLANGANQSAADRLFSISATRPPPRATQLAFSLTNPLHERRLDLIVGQFELFKFSLVGNYPSVEASGLQFKQFMSAAQRQYDVIILDAAPSNSFITECAIGSATDIVAPTTPDKYALRGIQAIFRLMSEGLKLSEPKPVHVLLNNVPAEISSAERAIVDAYPSECLPTRIRDSQYFRVRNADPGLRVRNPLRELAYSRGSEEIRATLRKIGTELLRRGRVGNGTGEPPQTS